jgi:hypothetical protein
MTCRSFSSTLLAIGLVCAAVGPALTAPAVTTNATHIDFSPPDVMVGLGTSEFHLVIRSDGSDPLNLQAAGVKGAHRADFHVGGCSVIQGVPVTLPPGAFCDIFVSFRPTAPGARSAVLFIQSDDPVQPLLLLPLTGNALAAAPRLLVTPSSLDFGTLPLQVASTPQAITVFSAGTLQLDITSVTSDSPDFVVVAQDCTVSPLASVISGLRPTQCTIQVRFTAPVSGLRAAHILIASNDPAGTASVSVIGVGAAPLISVSPTSLNLGSSEVGTATFGPKTVTIGNDAIAGAPSFNITAVTLSGIHPNDFILNGPSCTTVPAQGACTLSITFRPQGSGPRSGALLISSNAGPPVVVSMSGFGEFIPAGAPAPVPSKNDHQFVGLSGSLSTCASRGQALALPISVTRAFGSRNPVPAGAPAVPGPTLAAALAAGTLFGTARLDMMVYQVGPSGPHAVSLNGVPVGSIGPTAGGWVQQTLTVPTASLIFPGVASGTSSPSMANTLTFTPDTSAAGNCIAAAWARVSIKALSPVIFVHGNNSNGGFFVRQGIARAFNAAGIPNDTTINLAGGGAASVATNAMTLQTLIPSIARNFGVDSVHIVAHSKGGLDTRSWLSANSAINAAGATAPPFVVLSVTTLATPHLGSAGADLLLAIDATGVGVGGLTLTSLSALGLRASDAASLDLSTSVASGFNPPLPPAADYRMLGGNVDRNASFTVESFPVDEYAAARSEQAFLATMFATEMMATGRAFVTDGLVTFLYRFLFLTHSVKVLPVPVFLEIPFLPPGLISITPIFLVPGLPAPNDLLVTIQSATGAPPPFVAPFGTFGADHASIASPAIGASLVPFLITTDLTRGDLK